MSVVGVAAALPASSAVSSEHQPIHSMFVPKLGVTSQPGVFSVDLSSGSVRDAAEQASSRSPLAANLVQHPAMREVVNAVRDGDLFLRTCGLPHGQCILASGATRHRIIAPSRSLTPVMICQKEALHFSTTLQDSVWIRGEGALPKDINLEELKDQRVANICLMGPESFSVLRVINQQLASFDEDSPMMAAPVTVVFSLDESELKPVRSVKGGVEAVDRSDSDTELYVEYNLSLVPNSDVPPITKIDTNLQRLNGHGEWVAAAKAIGNHLIPRARSGILQYQLSRAH